MTTISIGNANAAQPLTALEKAPSMPEVEKSEETRGSCPKPVLDEYVPAEQQEPSGRYWLGRDENNQPKIFFDNPERAADPSKRGKDVPGTGRPGQDKSAEMPEKGGKKDARYVGDTGKVDREIERLKRKRTELQQRLNAEKDETKIKDMEKQLAQVERELKEKDNDTYRRQHTTLTQLS